MMCVYFNEHTLTHAYVILSQASSKIKCFFNFFAIKLLLIYIKRLRAIVQSLKKAENGTKNAKKPSLKPTNFHM